MDDDLCFARTEKGREELLGTAHALKPRPRQVLFLVNESISVHELRSKLPTCQELDSILEQLWEDGYIGHVKPVASQAQSQHRDLDIALTVLRGSRLEAARQHALKILASLAGEQSPAYAKVKNAGDEAALTQAVAFARKVLSAVASSRQAAQFENDVQAILRLPEFNEVPAPSQNPGKLNGIEVAKAHALEIVRSLVGERSPVYAKLNDAHNRADFIHAVQMGKKVIAAVSSSTKSQNFEAEVMSRMPDH